MTRYADESPARLNVLLGDMQVIVFAAISSESPANFKPRAEPAQFHESFWGTADLFGGSPGARMHRQNHRLEAFDFVSCRETAFSGDGL